ncbi:MAG: GNAT family N-acetyltransferase [Pirellulaceae bacterium]
MTANALAVRHIIRPDESSDEWDAYVWNHPKGSIFHTFAMHRVFNATPMHQSLAAAWRSDSGRIVAMIPAVRVETLSGVASYIASRSIWYAEPLCDASREGQQGLANLIEWHDKQVKHGTLFSEIRPLLAAGHEKQVLQQKGFEHYDYLNFVVDVSQPEDALWRKVSKSGRHSIRKSERRGVEVSIVDAPEAVERTYAMITESYKRAAVPLASIELFKRAYALLPEGVLCTRIATFEGRDVAAGFGLRYGDRFFAWYGGALRVPTISPFDCLTWDEIRWCSQNGIKYYDFGGAGKPHEPYGPRIFKAKFGGDCVQYGRYQRVHAPVRYNLASAVYKSIRQIKSVYNAQ